MQQSYFDHYRRRWTLSRWIHRKLLTALQENLVFVRSAFSAINIIERWIAGEGPPMNDHVVVRADRAGFIDYYRPDLPGIRASRVADLVRYYREAPPTDARTWLHDLDAASAWVEKLALSFSASRRPTRAWRWTRPIFRATATGTPMRGARRRR